MGESKGIAVHYCYILSCADDSFYVGVTDDPPQRVRDHNEGRGADWTAARRPVQLVWTEGHPTLSAARTRENQLKRWSHAKKDVLVRGSPRLRSGQGA
jgi:putative endonuclease